MSDYQLACTKCDEIVIKSFNNELKVRAKVIVVRDNSCFAVCKGCNTEIPVPFKLDETVSKSVKEPRLYLRK